MDETAKSFGQWLRHRRRELDLTQDELGRRVGCARITVRKMEADQMRPSKQMAERLQEQLGVPIGDREAFLRFARGGASAVALAISVTTNNLPLQLTSFVGREREIAEIRNLLKNHRLVTLTGSGGTGKTRLSLQIAAEVLDQFRDGVWFIELAPVNDAAWIPRIVLRVFGLSEEPARKPLEVLADYLGEKSLLIVLDNCEHLLDGSGQFVQAALQAGPGIKVLATSRETLHVGGEQAYRVPSLAAPDAHHLPPLDQLTQFEAVHLFAERATLVYPSFAVTDRNASAVAQICHRLDGIPLAIELAAARLQSMSLETLVSHLDDCFGLLTGGSRTALPRQQTLRATLDWSYNLLSESEKLLLQRLSVFRGGCILDAAEAVCAGEGIERAEILDLLSRLGDKSLLALNERGRYRMLETLRQYAGEKLIESGYAEWARDQHLKFMLELAERAEPEMRRQDQLLWLDRLDAELDNLRVAAQWAQARDAESSLRLASALWHFWDIRGGSSEGIDWLTNALTQTADSHTIVRARALSRAAYLMVAAGNLHANNNNDQLAARFAREAYALSQELEDRPSFAMALLTLGLSELYKKHPDAASSLRQALIVSREIGEHGLEAPVFSDFGLEAFNRNDLISAHSFLEQGLQESRLSGDERLVITGLRYLAYISWARGDLTQAEDLLEEAWRLAQAIGDQANMFFSRQESAQVALVREDYPRAGQLLQEAYGLANATNTSSNIAMALINLAMLDWALGNASGFYGRAQEALILARQASSPGLVAIALCFLGEAYRRMEDLKVAGDKYGEALAYSRAENFKEGYCFCLQGLGSLALARGQTERAARLFAARAKLRATVFAEDFYPFMVREREKQIADARAQLGEEAFNAAWAAGQAMNEEEMLSYALEDG